DSGAGDQTRTTRALSTTDTVYKGGEAVRRPALRALLAVVMLLAIGACTAKQSDSSKPIVVGSTLPLTGSLAATWTLHQIAGHAFLDALNANGGPLGRQVQRKLLDDHSDTARVSQLYEQLITKDKVDLIMGPYATPNILAAMAVAQRHHYVLPQHTAVIAP